MKNLTYQLLYGFIRVLDLIEKVENLKLGVQGFEISCCELQRPH
jgi:hypothetical protein